MKKKWTYAVVAAMALALLPHQEAQANQPDSLYLYTYGT